MNRRYCLTLDLKDDRELIAEYRRQHQSVWPDVVASIRSSGIVAMEIYLLGTRLFMIIEVDDTFSFERKEALDRENPRVQEWERLMCTYQKPLPQAKPGEKWLLMERICSI